MLDYLRMNGVDLLDYTAGDGHRDVSHVDGLVGLAQPRGESTPRTERHGTNNRGRFTGSKIVTIEGECWGVDIDDAYAQFDAVQAAFYASLNDPLGSLLTWRRAGGSVGLQARVKLAGPLGAPLEGGAAKLVYQAQVEQMDPRAYSVTLDTEVSPALSVLGGGLPMPFTFPILFVEWGGAVATVTNDGIIETPPLVRLYGPVTSPRYVNQTSGEQVNIQGEIGDGQYLEIDHALRTVKLNGDTSRMNLIDVPASTFFDVAPGAHDLRMLATNFGVAAHMEVETRSAYGG